MTDIWKDYRAAAGESKKSIRKKSSVKAYFLQELIFLFETESRAKHTKLKVVSKQVYIAEFYK